MAEFEKLNVPLHTLILNAGISGPTAAGDELTEDGFEKIFGVNHIGHFHLTKLLLPSLRKGKPSRVIVVSSEVHTKKVVFSNLTPPSGWNKRKFVMLLF